MDNKKQLEILCSEFGEEILKQICPDNRYRESYKKAKLEGKDERNTLLVSYRLDNFFDNENMDLIYKTLFRDEKGKLMDEIISYVKEKSPDLINERDEKFMKMTNIIYVPKEILKKYKKDSYIIERAEKSLFIWILGNDLKWATIAGQH